MKLYHLMALTLLLGACSGPPQIKLTIKAADVKQGMVIIKHANEIALSEPIKNGSLVITKQLQSPGYYSMSVIDNSKPLNSNPTFDIYLDNGDYDIETATGDTRDYPQIKSTSKVQQQLSEYYRFAQARGSKADRAIDSLLRYLESPKARALPAKQLNAFKKKVRLAQTNRRALELGILKDFTDKQPDNVIGAHIMSALYVEENPLVFNQVFQKFSAEVKTSDDGVALNNKLSRLLKLLPGAVAPEIDGQTIKGTSFSRATIKNAVTLVEFWQPGSSVSKLYHKQMAKGLILTDKEKKSFGILSVAINAQAGEWKAEVNANNLKWPQVIDAKGDGSTNIANWGLSTVPVFFLVDKNWRMIKPNVALADVNTEVEAYIRKHP